MKKFIFFTRIVVFFWILFQVIVVLTMNDMYQFPDARLTYIPNALWHYQHGTFYPTEHNLYDLFIQASGFINYLVVMLRIFGSFIAIMFANVFMNIVILYCIYYLAKHFFNEVVACISALLYCFLLSNVFIPIYIMSDLPSLFFSLVGFCWAINKRWYLILFGGLFLGYCHTMRPYEMAFILPAILFFAFHKVKLYKYLLLLLPYFIVIVLTGIYAKSQTGVFVTSSSTSGLAWVKVALGDGKYDAGNGIFIDKSEPRYQGLPNTYTFAQKDSIWKKRAMPGLKKIFIKHLVYWPFRIKQMYFLDTFFIPSTKRFNKDNLNDGERRATLTHKFYQAAWLWNNFVYFTILFLFFISLYVNRKSIFSEKGLFLLILLLLSFGLTLVIAEERYHYPCVFLLCIWAAYGFDTIRRRRRRTTLR